MVKLKISFDGLSYCGYHIVDIMAWIVLHNYHNYAYKRYETNMIRSN